MIFVTVGSDIPFDRLIKKVDRWAGERGRKDVFAQIGHGAWKPENISYSSMLEPSEFKERLMASKIVVGHAGMGTILTSLQQSKPILVMPRRGKLGETRNDHQMATAKQLLEMGKVNVAFDESELYEYLDRVDELAAIERISDSANESLTRALYSFVHRAE